MSVRRVFGKQRTTENRNPYTTDSAVFSIHPDVSREFLNWLREHNCRYSRDNNFRDILREYSNEEIIKNGFVNMAFEQYSCDGSSDKELISIVFKPSIFGTRCILRCICGKELKLPLRKELPADMVWRGIIP